MNIPVFGEAFEIDETTANILTQNLWKKFERIPD